MKKTGIVAIAGQPNVGKSTILNSLLRKKIAIVTEKPETTRDNIRGILTTKGLQIIFEDTPGMHKPHDLLGRIMMTRAQSALMEADIIMLITEPHIAFNDSDMNIIKYLPDPDEGKAVFLIINKADKVRNKEKLLPLIKKAAEVYPFKEIIPLSAFNEGHIDDLLKIIASFLPEKEFIYDADQITDKDTAFMIREIVREKVLLNTFQEIPHSVAVMIDLMEEENKGKLIRVHATIFVERTSQKSIIIGKNGSKIREIGTSARLDIEKYISKRVYLDLFVKVYDKWKKDPEALADIGYS